jgi:hypothetical protein
MLRIRSAEIADRLLPAIDCVRSNLGIEFRIGQVAAPEPKPIRKTG